MCESSKTRREACRKKKNTPEQDAHAPLDVESVEMEMCLDVRTKEDP